MDVMSSALDYPPRAGLIAKEEEVDYVSLSITRGLLSM